MATVDFPLVPVTPIIFLDGQSSKNNPISVSMGTLFFLAICRYPDSFGTPGFLIIKSVFLKSSILCFPKIYFIFLYFLSFFRDSPNSFLVFRSVTSIFALCLAKNLTTPTPPPCNPNPITVTLFCLKYFIISSKLFLPFRLCICPYQ